MCARPFRIWCVPCLKTSVCVCERARSPQTKQQNDGTGYSLFEDFSLVWSMPVVADLSFFTEFRFIILTHLIFGTVVRRFVNFSSWCFMPMAQVLSSFHFISVWYVWFKSRWCCFLCRSSFWLLCFLTFIQSLQFHYTGFLCSFRHNQYYLTLNAVLFRRVFIFSLLCE